MAVVETTRGTRRRRRESVAEGSFVSRHDLGRTRTRVTVRVVQVLVFAGVVVAGAGPLLWLLFASLNSTQDVLRDPLGVWLHAGQWGNYLQAWNQVDVSRYLGNTVVVAVGAWIANLAVSVLGGYVIAVLRPKWGNVLSGAILATLFLPSVVSLVPLYLTVIDLPPFGISLQNTYWAVWLPAAANAFGVLVVSTFFRALPRDLMEAAQLDGAGTLRVLWYVILPLSKPILGVVSLLAIVAAWKDYLWPSLVLTDTSLQPISVALPIVQKTSELSVFLAALFLATIVPVVLFLIFQRQFLASVSLSSGMKD
ncbi:carbohydrate ABC transporter permease [Leifsonia shinshuensis]|uniref:carbohydrate ABC transporter permease n=1 Tax=Leifsonia shinshuensis TaxID=150026 RepID=UPI001F5059C7|nr:carbohydrate ABC transporter permease [Leifsonia shinshuensis]MCI0156394.1 carbohydrate ABC transporter permease [Leifsonia shinshuensis]